MVETSKGFAKAGKSNVLRASDIKRISDTVRDRAVISGYSVLADKEFIRENEYNLNIPRYIDEMDMLGFLCIRAWDANRAQTAKQPRQAFIDQVWGNLKP